LHPLEQALADGRFPVGLEITPPRTRRPAVLLRRAVALPGATSVHAIQRPDRLASLESCRMLQGLGIPSVWHLVNRGRSRQDIAAELAVARRARLGAVLCMRGDHVAGDGADTPSLRETVSMAHETLPGAFVGATFNPYVDPARALRNLGPKLEAGAGWVVTQPAFEAERLERLRAFARGRAFVVPTVMPVLSPEGALAVQKRLRVPLPPALLARLRSDGAEAGWRWFEDTLADLRGIADGCAVVTPVADPTRGHLERIRAAIRRVRPGR